MRKKISNIGKRAFLTMLVILLMVMVSFGSNFFVQNAKGDIAEGTIWDGVGSPGWLMGGTIMCTVGMKFEVTQPVIVDNLGVYRYSGQYPSSYYNIRLWDADQNILREVTNPSIPSQQWTWSSITPIDLDPGTYVISVGIYGYPAAYQCGDDNPGPTADGIIEPLNWCRLANSYNGYPSEDRSESIIPYIDIHYTYDVIEAIDELIDDVNALPPSVPQGVINGLISKLNQAKTFLTPPNIRLIPALRKLGDFRDQVVNCPHMTQDQKVPLIQAVDTIIALL